MNELFIRTLNQSLSASGLVLIVMLLRLMMKKSPKWIHVLLWSIVAFRLICPFSIESPFSLIPDSIGSGTFLAEWLDGDVGDIRMPHEDAVNFDAAFAVGRVPAFDESGGYKVVTKQNQSGEASAIKNTIVPILESIWVTGMLLLSGYTVLRMLRLKQRISMAIPYQKNIYQCEYICSPFVFGILHPKIYLPFHLKEQDLDHVIAHELAHIDRKDHWWKSLGFLILIIHWFNPLMWLAYSCFCRDMELACDEKVIRLLDHEQRADYTQALLSCSISRNTMAAYPLAFGEIGVKERVRSVMHYKKPRCWVVAGSLAVCIVCAACFLTNPETMTEELQDFDPMAVTMESTDSRYGDWNETNNVIEHTQGMAADRYLQMIKVEDFSPVYDLELEVIDRTMGQPLDLRKSRITVEPEDSVGSLAYTQDPENPQILSLRFWHMGMENSLKILVDDLEYIFEVPSVMTYEKEVNQEIAYKTYTATLQKAVFYPKAVAIQMSDISDKKLLEEYLFLTVDGKKYLPFTVENETGLVLLYVCEKELSPEDVQNFTIGKEDGYVVDLKFE